ncbi:hypothetical protein F4X88_06000 [Candidatus Poribacteria bacterium]|nr:hypothetical protein [Candidatus Poribacteria bacterium]
MEAVDLAEALGVKYIRIGGVVFEGERVDNIELSLTEHEYVAAQLQQLQAANRHIKIHDAFRTRSRMKFPRYNEGDTCYYSNPATAIGADGKVYVCCIWKYRPEGVIADLNQERFVDAWRNGALQKFYKNFNIAEKCTRCFLKEKNDFIHSLVEAEHINFV